MRITYRNKSVRNYWQQRWDAVSIDDAMENEHTYPLCCALSILSASSKETAKILEAGCGTGRILIRLAADGFDVVGIDFIPTAIKKIKERAPSIQAEVGDITKLRFKDNTFSHVLAFGLYHNFDMEMMTAALRETARVMQPNGLICMSFRADNLQNKINDYFFNNQLNETEKNDDGTRIFHKINLTASEISLVVQSAGFEIQRIYEMNNMPLLFKVRFFRHRSQKEFNEKTARKEGYKLNKLGFAIHRCLQLFFPKQFCNLYVVDAKKVIYESYDKGKS